MNKKLRPGIILFLMFFSLSGSVESEPPNMVSQSPIYEMVAKEEQEIVVFSQTVFSADEEQGLLLEEDLPVEMSLDLQNQVLERQIQQADDMGIELDKIIQMLEE